MSKTDHCPLRLSDTDSESNDIKEIKRRNRLNARQVNRLMEVFDQTTKPKTEIRIQLAEELGMHPRAVQIWFQNRRQKLKKESHDTNPSDSHSHFPIEAAKLSLSHTTSFFGQQSTNSCLPDTEYGYVLSPSNASFNLQKSPSSSFDLSSQLESDKLLNPNPYLNSVPISTFSELSSDFSPDSLTLLNTCDTTSLRNQDMLNISNLAPEIVSSSTHFTGLDTLPTSEILAPSDYTEDFGTSALVYSGLGSLGLDLSAQIDLLQQQSLNNTYGSKMKTPTTEKLNWSSFNMSLDITKMNAMKNRAQGKPRSKSFQHQEESTDTNSESSPWNRLLRTHSSDFQLKQPPLKKRRHTTSTLELLC